MKNRQVYIVSALLIAVSLCIFLYKWKIEGLPVVPGKLATAWQVELRVQFEANNGPVKINTFLPKNNIGRIVLDPRIIAPGYGVTESADKTNAARVLAIRKATGLEVIYIQFVAYIYETLEQIQSQKPPVPKTYTLDEAKFLAVQDLLAEAAAKSSDEKTQIAHVLQSLSSKTPVDSVKALLGGDGSLRNVSKVAALVLNTSGIAARRVSGIDLELAGKNVKLIHWLEVFLNDKWISYDIPTGQDQVPETYLAWWRGNDPLITLTGGTKPETSISAVRLDQSVLYRVLDAGNEIKNRLITFSLFGLPIATQQVYRILMVVPLGIFFLLLLRNVIGVKSLGTFMPVLIAIAFRETHLAWGIILFTTIVGSGLLFRFYLEHLKLLLVPRLAAVLIFVVLLMAVMSVVTNRLGLDQGISVALFPMVIMTMTIERVSVLWDERGAAEALTQAIGSLAIAAVCYLLMTLEIVEHLFFTFPELLLILLAASMLLGRYSGYRLLELRRFKVLAGEKS